MREFIPPASRFIHLPNDFTMKRGGKLYGARIAYETIGQLDSKRENTILILTGLSPDAHVASHLNDMTHGWWEGMLGPGKPIDTNRWFVICVNSLGSCKGSTGPASIDPTTGKPYRLNFPELSIEDIADATAYMVHSLGIEQLACVIGASMGGMSALALLSRHPALARNHINISSATHSLPFSIAIRSLQRELICIDPNWNQGQYNAECYPVHGMTAARKLGLITYRSAIEWETRFSRKYTDSTFQKTNKLFGREFEIESYLEYHAQRFLHHFDPNSYLYLSQSMDWFDLGESYGGYSEKALKELCIEKSLVIGVETDILFPLKQQYQISEGLKSGGGKVQFLVLKSPKGHDAFLVDIDSFGPPIRQFLLSL
ncbi:homoserine O-acetyltransferase [Xenorhabdus sp. XENO-1]|uniref:homoserine O-acetyltransferase MetX n=1 Tax=Xenorhabdus bovienii TaxID=40576 RepID=UPI0020CA4CB9|nr:homoserine O-acetyltransferase [Xenorhabdus bovienii]MCP9269643.1 homoserine O-acetyltransferase [Xenorhabdus bovienii subsp. africana]